MLLNSDALFPMSLQNYSTILLTLNYRGALCSVCTDEKTHLVFIAVILCVPNVGKFVCLCATLWERTLRYITKCGKINYTISNFVVGSSYTTCACPCDCYLNPFYISKLYLSVAIREHQFSYGMELAKLFRLYCDWMTGECVDCKLHATYRQNSLRTRAIPSILMNQRTDPSRSLLAQRWDETEKSVSELCDIKTSDFFIDIHAEFNFVYVSVVSTRDVDYSHMYRERQRPLYVYIPIRHIAMTARRRFAALDL